MEKYSPEEIREQFDAEVDRFSNEKSGQGSAVDSALVLKIVEETAAVYYRGVQNLHLCDIGCGGGNFSLRLARKLPGARITLIDLSSPMLQRAAERLRSENFLLEESLQGDIRELPLPEKKFDLVVAGAVLHHLREPEQWKSVFAKIHHSLKTGGAFWMWDLIRHEIPAAQEIQQRRYAQYLAEQGGKEYQEEVFEMIHMADTPETLSFLMRTMSEAGFQKIDILHKNTVFAAVLALK